MSVLRFSMFLLVGLFIANQSCSQVSLSKSLKIQNSGFDLFSILSEIKESGVPVAYSTDKIPNKEVVIFGEFTVFQLLERLQEDKLIKYQVSSSQILITNFQLRRFTLNGVIKDSETGEFLIGASIQVGNGTVGTITNAYGYYSITLSEGSYEVRIKHIGYQDYVSTISLGKNTYLKLSLRPITVQLEEVEINSITSDINISSEIPSISRIKIDEQLSQVPYLLGEVDVLRNALLRPGISVIGEDASGIHIRGGRVDQNLVLLDEAIVYNPYHYILASVFNPDAVNDIKLYKGYIPPSYGGRTSSVIEIIQKEGNTENLSYSGGIGPFSARGLIEGPFRKGKSSFLGSFRQSLLNLDIDDFASTSVKRSRNRFQDVNIKINSKPNAYNTYYLSGYVGNDRNVANLNSIRNWGNSTANFRWNHIFSPKVFSNLSSFISEYSYRVESDETPGAFVSTSRIVNYSLKSDLTYTPKPTNEVNFGFSAIFHKLKPGNREPFDATATTTNTIRLDTEHGLETAFYIGQQTDIGRFKVSYGIRYSALHNFGPDSIRVYSTGKPLSDSTVIDMLRFKKREVVKRYFNPEPRIAVGWQLNPSTAVKAAFSRTAQYIHLISNTLDPAPTDIWKLSDTFIPPSISEQYIVGLYKNFRNNQWESIVEWYYKDNENDITYRNGADLIFNENVETELSINKGRAYGLEFYLEKKFGELTGWVSYALSRTETRIDEDNQTGWVLNNFDRTHDFSTTWAMKLSDRTSVSGNFVYSTGIPLTLPGDKFLYEGNLVPVFTERNTSRLPDFHRLDISLKVKGRSLKKDGSPRKNRDALVFTLYNVYARKNANSYFFRQSENNPGLGEIVKYSVFGTIIPAISYKFKF